MNLKRARIAIEIADIDGREVIVRVEMPVGSLLVIGTLASGPPNLRFTGVHVQGLSPGALGRAGINAIARRMLEETGGRSIQLEGSLRTTGARPGRRRIVYAYPSHGRPAPTRR